MTRHALIIGIAEYASFQRLEKATNDAEAVAQLLEKYGNFDTIKRLPQGWNEAEEQYYVAPEQLTGKELGEALQTFLFEQAVGQEALIYFTGHGFKTVDVLGQENGYLATSNCLLEASETQITGQRYGISLESLNQLLVEARLSSFLMLLDCCHSGYLIEARLMGEKLSVFNKTRNSCLIASSRRFEESYVGRESSFFTGALLAALSPQSADREGNINSLNLFDRIESQLRQSGQQPIYMGYGSSIAVVSYPQPTTVAAETQVNPENPYVGLESFDGGKSKYFFGRDTAIRDLQVRLNQGRFLSIIGASGAGKSSLIKAGLLPLLTRKYAIASLTPGANPPQILIDRLTSLHAQNLPFLLFIDQFEEVFTLCKDEELRKSFFHQIAEIVKNSQRQGQAIVAIRGDFLDRCAEYPEIAALVNEAQPTTYMVEPLTSEELYRAIAEPAKLHGVSLQAGLVERMAREVAEQPGALPLLQYALRELWRVGIEEAESPTAMLTWEKYNQIGGVGGALDKRADLIYRSFPEQRDCDLVRRLCLELVELGESDTVTRRRVTKESLAAEADSPEQFDRVLDSLVQNRLAVMTLQKVGDENYEPYVEVTHEALLSKWGMLRDWISQNRDDLRRKRRFAGYFGTWRDRGKSDEALLSGLWLSDAEELQGQESVRLLAEEREFIARSIERRDREVQAKLDAVKRQAKIERQRTRILAGGSLILTTFIGFWGLSIVRQAQISTVRALIETAKTFSESNKGIEAFLTNIQALQILDSSKIINEPSLLTEIKEVLVESKERNRLENISSKIWSFSIYNNQIVAATSDGKVSSWNINGQFQKSKIGHERDVYNVNSSNKHDFLVSVGYDGKLVLWDTELYSSIKSVNAHKTAAFDARFSSDDKYIVSSGADGIVKIWEVKNRSGQYLSNIKSFDAKTIISSKAWRQRGYYRILSVDFNPKINDLLAYSGEDDDGSVHLWNWKTQQQPELLSSSTTEIAQKEIVNIVKFSSDGSMLASADDRGQINIWRLKDRKLIANFVGHKQGIYSLAFSANNKIIASGSADNSISLWDLGQIKDLTPPKLTTMNGHNSTVTRLDFIFNDKMLVSASKDRTIRIWSLTPNSTSLQTMNSRELLNYSCREIEDYLKTSTTLADDKRKLCL